MTELFSEDYFLLWTALLALALFYPVRQLIWVLYVRRANRQQPTDEPDQARLKRRASVTSALLCFVFALLYAMKLFSDQP